MRILAPVVVMPGKVIPEVEPEVLFLSFKFGVTPAEELIDQIGEVETLLKDLTKWVEAGRGVLKTKLAVPSPEQPIVSIGKGFQAVFSSRSRRFLSTPKLLADMGEAFVEKYMDVTNFTELRIRPKEEVIDDKGV